MNNSRGTVTYIKILKHKRELFTVSRGRISEKSNGPYVQESTSTLPPYLSLSSLTFVSFVSHSWFKYPIWRSIIAYDFKATGQWVPSSTNPITLWGSLMSLCICPYKHNSNGYPCGVSFFFFIYIYMLYTFVTTENNFAD